MQKPEIDQFLSSYPANVQDIAQQLRQIVTSVIPAAREELDPSARIIGYGLGPGYAGLICTIILSKRGVKLGIVRSAQLPDPQQLLEGTGKQHRYVAFEQRRDLQRPGLKPLLEAAVVAWRDRTAGTTGNAVRQRAKR